MHTTEAYTPTQAVPETPSRKSTHTHSGSTRHARDQHSIPRDKKATPSRRAPTARWEKPTLNTVAGLNLGELTLANLALSRPGSLLPHQVPVNLTRSPPKSQLWYNSHPCHACVATPSQTITTQDNAKETEGCPKCYPRPKCQPNRRNQRHASNGEVQATNQVSELQAKRCC